MFKLLNRILQCGGGVIWGLAHTLQHSGRVSVRKFLKPDFGKTDVYKKLIHFPMIYFSGKSACMACLSIQPFQIASTADFESRISTTSLVCGYCLLKVPLEQLELHTSAPISFEMRCKNVETSHDKPKLLLFSYSPSRNGDEAIFFLMVCRRKRFKILDTVHNPRPCYPIILD